ncbi:MAG: helix-turn-helix transcriptional regulator [Bauldia sp.]|nr:helix-turn-helix transcriptional regulator [Bauldia sp.]
MHIRTPLDLGLVIRQQRRHLGLNQTDLASRVGVGRQWIVAIEHGKARAELGLVLRTLAALDLTLAVHGGSDATTRKDSSGAPIDIDAVVDAAKGRRP